MNSLFISLYEEKNGARRLELETCLMRNCAVFDRIFVLAEGSENGSTAYLDHLAGDVIVLLPVSCRPTFRTFFMAINGVSGTDDVNVIANSDIYFEELAAAPASHQCFALTRWDMRNGHAKFLNRVDSQDTWMLRGPVRQVGFADFHLGVPGCDNRINLELSRAGYVVSNPSLTIKTYHLHANPTDHSKAVKRVNPPYLKLEPCV